MLRGTSALYAMITSRLFWACSLLSNWGVVVAAVAARASWGSAPCLWSGLDHDGTFL